MHIILVNKENRKLRQHRRNSRLEKFVHEGYNVSMGFIKKLIAFLKGFFSISSAEAKQRREFKQLENDLRLSDPVLYKNGIMQGTFGEAVFILYQNTKPVHELLNSTICAHDVKISRYYARALFITAFDDEMHTLYSDLDYEKRKNEVQTAESIKSAHEQQQKKLDLFLRKLTGEQFVKIDAIIAQLQHLNDLCRVSFISVLNLFDRNFQSLNPQYKPNFKETPLADIEPFLEEFYFVAADFQITEGMARAITALAEIRRCTQTEQKDAEEELLGQLKNIQAVITRILSGDTLLKLMRLLKTNLSLTLDKARFSSDSLVAFTTGLRETFNADLQRIETEIQNEIVASEIQNLFEYNQLQQINGYNQEEDAFLQQNTSLSFPLTLPLKVLKSFLITFFDERAQSLLNDVAIEGFFNNPAFKTEFSSLVYNCCDILTKIRQFESKFSKEGENYSMLIRSYVNDSRRDASFLQTLSKLVDAINTEVKKLLAINCQLLSDLYRHSVEILGDLRKSTPDYISNAKVLFSSIRNRDKVEYLESQFPKWKIFFEIMSDYGIVNKPFL